MNAHKRRPCPMNKYDMQNTVSFVAQKLHHIDTLSEGLECTVDDMSHDLDLLTAGFAAINALARQALVATRELDTLAFRVTLAKPCSDDQGQATPAEADRGPIAPAGDENRGVKP